MTNEEIVEILKQQEIPYESVGDIIEINMANITKEQMDFLNKMVPDDE